MWLTGLTYDVSLLQANGGKAKMNDMCSTGERKGADAKDSDVKENLQYTEDHEV